MPARQQPAGKGSGAVVRSANEVDFSAIAAGRGAAIQVLIGPAQGTTTYVTRRFRLEPGGSIPAHTNDVEHQQYVLRGRGRIAIDGVPHDVGPDDTLFIPAGAPHSYDVLEGPFEFLCIVPDAPDRLHFLEPPAGC
jgi:quercetin dioxygenase-like cupin family protein